MAKIAVDIDNIVSNLQKLGYVKNDILEKENNGKHWQIKFSNSGAIVNIYDSNNIKNTVVNGKCSDEEKNCLKTIVDDIKSGEYEVDTLNETIVELIHSQKEDFFYDFKQTQYGEKKKFDLLHDVICLLNNIEHREAYLIIGVTNDFEVVGVETKIESNNLIDWLRHLKFAGNIMPDVELKHLYYMYHQIEVIVCKPSMKKCPYYIEKKEGKVEPYHIYTRVGDTNTPVNENASYEDICNLWRYHFSEEQ